jgi:ferritin-like metal-binding protein YciE
MAQRETLLGWLKDAHSMEKALLPVLENHANDAADMPEVQARLTQHLEETRRHVDMVHQCIQSLGGDTSALKDMVGNITGAVQSVSSAPFADEPVKNFLSDFAAENFEVASYTSLVAAAQALGETQIAATCQQILQEDQAMAQWLQQQIPTVTNAFLSREAAATA